MRSGRMTRLGPAIAAILAISFLATGTAIGASPSASQRSSGSTPDAKVTGFHLVETKDGAKLWEIWGDLAEVFEKKGVANVMKVSNQVAVTLYSEHGKLTTWSDKVIVNTRTKNVRLEGNVTATSEQGGSLKTQSLVWSAEDRRVSTQSPITLTRRGLVSRGVGMEAETDLERARLLSRVQSKVIPARAGGVTTKLPASRKGVTR